jgi:hypothetical protein
MEIDFAAEFASTMGMDMYREVFGTRYGEANQTKWRCGDGWIVGYTTERISYAKDESNNGKFAAFAYKPIGKGARSGEASEWKLVYWRAFTKRKTARARAEDLYFKHSK